MIVAVVGSRTITNYKLLCEVIKKSGFTITKIISGGALGVDSLARIYANANNIEFEEFPANWQMYKKRAGYLRNLEMAQECDAVIALWNGKSKGTAGMLELCKARSKKIYLWTT